MSRLEKAARARELRDQGLALREIGQAMADEHARTEPYPYKTVYDWLTDPDGSRVKARKDSYRGTCLTCGAATTGTDGPGKAPTECGECHNRRRHDERRWTPETCVEAMRAWAAKHGRAPRSHPDWRHAGPDHPAASTVVQIIGWNECLRRAGLPVIHHSRTAQHITNDELVALYAAGLSFKEIAEWHDAGSPSNVYQRIVAHGGVEIRRGFNVFTEMEIKRAKRMYADGHGTTAIASATGHTHSGVRRMLVREGVQLRGRADAQPARRKAAA